MKTKLYFLTCMCFIGLFTYAQETTVDLSMETGYTNQVYYKLSTEATTTILANSWDVAFLRTSNFDQALVVNDGIGIEVFEAATSVNDWDNVAVTDEALWTPLFNSDAVRADGAFMKGAATYGWGEYNPTTHVVEGTTVYVLKYADGVYKKFVCESYSGGNYNIKYATYDAVNSIWEEDKTAVISNTTNTDNNYNYYSLQNEEQVVAAPATSDWDLVFRKYTTDLGGGTMYNVTGVLQADGVEVAQTTSSSDATNLTYATAINTIGYDWKSLNNTTFTFDVDSDIHYYIKDAEENVFKVYFTEFGGTSTGEVQFKAENITQTLGVEDVNENVSFGVYPNPVSANKMVNVVFDVNSTNEDKYNIGVYNLTGKQVYTTTVTNVKGFYNKELNLKNLEPGVYMLRFQSGNTQKTKRIILQ